MIGLMWIFIWIAAHLRLRNNQWKQKRTSLFFLGRDESLAVVPYVSKLSPRVYSINWLNKTIGNIIQGHETSFMRELSPGDAIIIGAHCKWHWMRILTCSVLVHPTTLAEETKIVRMVLSNMSMGISSAFSSDLISTMAFRWANIVVPSWTVLTNGAFSVMKVYQSSEGP